jgi:hypothetical protein
MFSVTLKGSDNMEKFPNKSDQETNFPYKNLGKEKVDPEPAAIDSTDEKSAKGSKSFTPSDDGDFTWEGKDFT